MQRYKRLLNKFQLNHARVLANEDRLEELIIREGVVKGTYNMEFTLLDPKTVSTNPIKRETKSQLLYILNSLEKDIYIIEELFLKFSRKDDLITYNYTKKIQD